MDDVFAIFAVEAQEQLTEMEQGLLRLEEGDRDPETLNAVFRSAHTIKGAAGVVEVNSVVGFTHVLENVLDKLRNGEIQVSGELTSALLAGCDHIGRLLAGLAGSGQDEPDEATLAVGEAIIARLVLFAENETEESLVVVAPESAPASAGDQAFEGEGRVRSDCWHISLRFGPDVLRNGMEPLAFLRYLLTLGDIVHMETLLDALPDDAEEADPEGCYLGFEIRFQSSASQDEIENVFAFVRDDCQLHVLPPKSPIADYLQLIDSLPEGEARLEEILVRSGALTHEELAMGLNKAMLSAEHPDDAGQFVVMDGEAPLAVVTETVVERAVPESPAPIPMSAPSASKPVKAPEARSADKKAGDARLIRVHADKLDQLIDLVGELVIAGASANLIAQQGGDSRLVEATSVISRLVENIRDSALQLRMVPIGETFNRFHRVVRDVAHDLGKDIELLISGAETELDKSVVEKIGDPLMHLMRNAMDHGIEPAEVRLARGKSAKGRVELNAYHDSGSIVIEVLDDGGGLNRDKIYQKAVERGLIQPGQILSDAEIQNLIFEPGFSTADKVSNLSGRGVGMDVVRKNIQSLRGSVVVDSTEGEGSRFLIRLPLTLAIIDGFLVGVGQSSFVIPLDLVVECIELRTSDLTDRNYLNLRGEVLPFVRIRQMFGCDDPPPKRENIVVVQYAGYKAGIVVDELMGEFQTVIKPLGSLFRHLRGIAGSTILGSGEVALILDVQSLVQRVASMEAEEFNPRTQHTLLT